jgi:hypothetical protein
VLFDPAAHERLTDRPWDPSWARAAIGAIGSVLLAGGELTWRAGPLAKGPGLCHGTAGNGLAFLAPFDRTGDDRCTSRAASPRRPTTTVS